MKLTQWSGQIQTILTRTEVPLWVRRTVFAVLVILWLVWFSGVFGF